MVGKRRTASKAPRTPLSRRSEKETEELAVTPRQELAKMGLCKEDLFMCSQPADSQIDVRWDCNSPEALLQFKRYRGQILRSDVADIVKKLGDEIEDSTRIAEPLPGLWMSSKDDTGPTKPFKSNLQRQSNRRRRFRKPSSFPSDECADELLKKLTMALHRHEDAGVEALTISPNSKQHRVSPGSPELVQIDEQSEVQDQVTTFVNQEAKPTNDASKDLFKNSEEPSHKRELHSDKISGIGSLVTGNLLAITEDDWSDDDLFANDSLLMKVVTQEVCSPTPQPTSRMMKRKSLLNSPSAPLIKTKRFSDAPCATSTQINQNGISGNSGGTNGKSSSAKSLKAAFVKNEEACSGSDLDSSRGAGTSDPYKRENTCANLNQATGLTTVASGSSNTLTISRNKNHNQEWKRHENLNNNCRYYGQIRNASGVIHHEPVPEFNRTDVIPSSQTLPQKRNIPSTTGSSFKRHNTFPSVTVSPRNGRAMGRFGNPVVPHSGLSSSNKGNSKLSKDSGVPVSKPVTFSLNRKGNKTNIQTGGGLQGCGQGETVTRCESTNKPMVGLPKPFDYVPSPRNSRRRRSSTDASMFNTSLTDDLLCQLAEPDEILDSQFDMGLMEETKHTTIAGNQNAGINSKISAELMTNNTRRNQLPQAEPEAKNHLKGALKTSESKIATCTVSKTGHNRAVQGFRESSLSSGAVSSAEPSFAGSQIQHTSTQSQPGKYHFKSHNSRSGAHNPVNLNPAALRHGTLNPDAPRNGHLNSYAPRPGTLKPGADSSHAPRSGTLNSAVPKPGTFSYGANKPGTLNLVGSKLDTLNSGGLKPGTFKNGAQNPIANVPNRTLNSGVGTGKPVPLVSTTSVKTASTDVKDAQHSFNDSFMNDDELSNPEVIAMLEEVETQATQASQGSKSPVFKCTPDEIQKKKKAAMERRRKNLQLQNKKPASRTTSKHYKPLF